MNEAPRPPRGGPTPNRLLVAPILPTLFALSLPNFLALGTQSLVAIAETTYIGVLGTEALAAMALVFPMIMLTQMMSSGAMGGGVSSAISRALGGGNEARARSLAFHALVIGFGGGLLFTAVFLACAQPLFALLGGKGLVLDQAVAYARTFFSGAVAIWLFNTLASIARGTGNMKVPSATIIGVGVLQILLGGTLGLGAGPIPRFGLPGVAMGQILAFVIGALVLLTYLRSSRSRLRMRLRMQSLDGAMFFDILKVGALACLSPLQSILTVIILARFAADFGTEVLAGYGIGVRLELLLVPIAFSIGVACVPMVGMAIGAGDIARARRVAWTGATVSAGIIGSIGLLFAVYPDLWAGLFSDHGPVRDAVDQYLSVTGLGFPAYGFGLCLYFASQGSGRVLGPVLGGTVRLVIVAAGGWWLLMRQASFADFAMLVTVAMFAYGASTALFVWMTRWSKG